MHRKAILLHSSLLKLLTKDVYYGPNIFTSVSSSDTVATVGHKVLYSVL